MQLCTSETKRVETRTSRLSVNTKVGENQRVLEPFERLRNSTFCFDFAFRFFSSVPISSLIFISLSCFHLWHWRSLCFSSLSFHLWYPGEALSRSFGLSVNQRVIYDSIFLLFYSFWTPSVIHHWLSFFVAAFVAVVVVADQTLLMNPTDGC